MYCTYLASVKRNLREIKVIPYKALINASIFPYVTSSTYIQEILATPP